MTQRNSSMDLELYTNKPRRGGWSSQNVLQKHCSITWLQIANIQAHTNTAGVNGFGFIYYMSPALFSYIAAWTIRLWVWVFVNFSSFLTFGTHICLGGLSLIPRPHPLTREARAGLGMRLGRPCDPTSTVMRCNLHCEWHNNYCHS